MSERENNPDNKAVQQSVDQGQQALDPSQISFSNGLAGFLAKNASSLGFTSYQTGRFYLLGHDTPQKLAVHETFVERAMGIWGDAQRIYLGTLAHLLRYENMLMPNQIANETFDKVYVPRNIQTTGAVDIHELAVQNDGKVVFINTKYSCLCELSLSFSFKPIWKPKFISALVPEDRCHLNGLAMQDGKPKYVSAICRSDVVDGWRDRRHDGGIIIDVTNDEIVAEGLSMPHSPRLFNGKLWILNSGTGELGWIDQKKKSFVPFCFIPGFARGLAFCDNHAIITLSKPRYSRFEGLDLDNKMQEKDADAWCGVQVIDLQTGAVKEWLRFDGAIQELFDICVLPGVKKPMTLGLQSKELKDTIAIETPAWAVH